MVGEQKSKFKSYKNLYRILYPQLSAVAYHYVKDIEASNEIVQEIFLNAWAGYTVFDEEKDTTEFFYDTVINTCVNTIKDKQKSKFKSCRDVFKSLYPQLSAIAYQHVKDLQESKEIVQEVFLNAWADYTEFDNENDKTEFFYDAVVNKCVDKQTKGIALNKPTEPAIDESEETTINPSAAIENILSTLPKKEADTIRRSIEDYK